MMRITDSLLAGLGATLLLTTTASAQQGNLLVHGGFESNPRLDGQAFVRLTPGTTDLSGWQVVSGSVDHIESEWSASRGARSLDLNGLGRGAIAQTAPTEPGRRYVLLLDLAVNPDGGAAGRIRVRAAATTADLHVEAGTSTRRDMNYVTRSVEFVAQSAQTTIHLEGLNPGPYGAVLDNVVLLDRGQCDAMQNGSFEGGVDPVDLRRYGAGEIFAGDWAVTFGNIEHARQRWNASSGGRSVDLNGNQRGGIARQLATRPGREYVVLFDMSATPGNVPFDHRTMIVRAGGKTATYELEVGTRSANDMQWVERSMTFTAQSSRELLQFSSGNDSIYGPMLDNVRVFERQTEDGLRNGGFESAAWPTGSVNQRLSSGSDQLIGWDITSGSLFMRSDWDCADGNTCLDFGDWGSRVYVRTSIPTIPGRSYVFRCAVSADPNATGGTLDVHLANRRTVLTFQDYGNRTPRNMGWQERTILFTATAATTEIRLEKNNTYSNGIVLDDLRVFDATGRIVPFGQGCPGSQGDLTLSGLRPARIGQSMTVRIGGASVAQAGVLLLSTRRDLTGNLPMPLDAIGMPGCSLYVMPEFSMPFLSILPTGHDVSMAIPDRPELVGAELYLQAALLDPAANAPGWALTNAGLARVGS